MGFGGAAEFGEEGGGLLEVDAGDLGETAEHACYRGVAGVPVADCGRGVDVRVWGRLGACVGGHCCGCDVCVRLCWMIERCNRGRETVMAHGGLMLDVNVELDQTFLEGWLREEVAGDASINTSRQRLLHRGEARI